MSSKLEIARMLVLSTAHITPETNERLPDGIDRVIAYEKGEYGWVIYVPSAPAEPTRLPVDLRELIGFARRNNCDWIMLDRDGNVIGDLPAYEWGAP